MERTKAYMYLRLSRDDGDEGESNSITNQRELIKSYADKAGFKIIKEFIDDGYTGSNFDRPDFKRGEFIEAFVLYGYKKNKKQKNHLIVDRNVSHIIRKIFEMKIEGYSSKVIADELNKLGIQTPGTYKESQGSNYSTGFASNKNKWQAKMINRIIENRVYIGVLEQGKRTKLNYKSNKEIKVLEEDWIKVEGTHEAIVTETMFNVANKMMGRDILNRKSKPDFLTGLLYCADCGNQLIRRRQKTKDGYKIYYICGLYNRGNGCSRHSIREEEILSSLDFILRQHIKYQEELFTRIRETDLSKTKYQLDLDDLIADKKKYETLRKSLYLDLEDGLIDEDEFQSFRKSYQLKIKDIEGQMISRKKAYEDLKDILSSKENWLTDLEKYKNIESIDRQTLALFVDRILVEEKDKEGRSKIAVFFNDMEKLDILKRIISGVKKGNASNLISFNTIATKNLTTPREGVVVNG